MAAVTCWHRLYGKEWCGSKRATAIASCFHQSAEFQVEVCFMFGFVCLFVSGLGTLVWSYGFPLNIHEKFSRVSPRCKHKGSNVWTFSLCSTSLFLLVWAVLAAFWHMAENFFFSFFPRSPCFYHHRLLVSDHAQSRGCVAAGGVQEFQGCPWESIKKEKRMSKSCSNRGRAMSTVHFGSWYGREVHNLWF